MFFGNETVLTFKLRPYAKLKPYLHLHRVLILD